jgi:hypothetical protein
VTGDAGAAGVPAWICSRCRFGGGAGPACVRARERVVGYHMGMMFDGVWVGALALKSVRGQKQWAT